MIHIGPVALDLSAATWKKAIRLAAYAFIALYPVSNVIGNVTGSQPVDVSALKAAAGAAVVAAIGVLWNAIADPNPIPSLNPHPQADE